MLQTNQKVDAYINRSADFAKPILTHLRKLIHKACPSVEEKIKWEMPSFEYKGMFCGFASFKQHCTFGFWKASLMKLPPLKSGKPSNEAMGDLGRITSLKDLPKDKIIISWLKVAMQLNEDGIKVVKKKPTEAEQKALIIPDYFNKALLKNKKALVTFEQFSYSNKKEYLMWVSEAKTDETRNFRLSQSITWMAEGKHRNWKYMKQFK